MYETLLLILKGVYDLRIDKDARRLAAIAIVAGGYGGDMPEDQCYDLLDDMDFYYNKVKCKKIERMLPQLSKMVITESSHLIYNNVIMEVKKTNIEGNEFYQPGLMASFRM